MLTKALSEFKIYRLSLKIQRFLSSQEMHFFADRNRSWQQCSFDVLEPQRNPRISFGRRYRILIFKLDTAFSKFSFTNIGVFDFTHFLTSVTNFLILLRSNQHLELSYKLTLDTLYRKKYNSIHGSVITYHGHSRYLQLRKKIAFPQIFLHFLFPAI